MTNYVVIMATGTEGESSMTVTVEAENSTAAKATARSLAEGWGIPVAGFWTVNPA